MAAACASSVLTTALALTQKYADTIKQSGFTKHLNRFSVVTIVNVSTDSPMTNPRSPS
jgi:hypothetical protein